MDDIKTTAIRSLWSKNRLQAIDFELYAQTVIQNCSVCGCTPPGVLTYKRKGEVYILHWCHVQYDLENNLKPVCPTCKWLLTNNDLRGVLTTCARIMARRMHGKINNWLNQGKQSFPSPGKLSG